MSCHYQAKYEGTGRQGTYDAEQANRACLVQCKERGQSSFSSPARELAGTGESPYYPDGVECNTGASGKKMYCVQHQCQYPPSGRGARSGSKAGEVQDVGSEAIASIGDEEHDPEIMPSEL